MPFGISLSLMSSVRMLMAYSSETISKPPMKCFFYEAVLLSSSASCMKAHLRVSAGSLDWKPLFVDYRWGCPLTISTQDLAFLFRFCCLVLYANLLSFNGTTEIEPRPALKENFTLLTSF